MVGSGQNYINIMMVAHRTNGDRTVIGFAGTLSQLVGAQSKYSMSVRGHAL